MISISTKPDRQVPCSFPCANISIYLSSSRRTEAVELAPYRHEGSTLRVVDGEGKAVWQCEDLPGAGLSGGEVSVGNLKAGLYFVEIEDDFYHQVREVHIPAA